MVAVQGNSQISRMFGMKPDGTVAGRRNRRGDMTVSAVDWLVLLGTVVILFAVDLTVATLRRHAVGFREATLWSVFFVAVAVGFGFVLAALEGWGYAGSTSPATSWRKASPLTTCSSSSSS
jgi:hypothetical protein